MEEVKDGKVYERTPSFSKNRFRNLRQYKDLTDEEFEERMAQKQIDAEPSKDFEDRIKKKLSTFEEDYDLSDLKINDREILRALIQALISLEDYEQVMYKLKKEVTIENLTLIDKVSKTMSDLRSDISKMQDDLKITRRTRKSDQEASVIAYIDSLKLKAKEYYESKMSYIFCPDCKMLLGTIWTLYPEENNKIELTCHRELQDGSICNCKVKITTKELLSKKGTNNLGVMPEALL
jgi:hypothetical protein